MPLRVQFMYVHMYTFRTRVPYLSTIPIIATPSVPSLKISYGEPIAHRVPCTFYLFGNIFIFFFNFFLLISTFKTLKITSDRFLINFNCVQTLCSEHRYVQYYLVGTAVCQKNKRLDPDKIDRILLVYNIYFIMKTMIN